VRNRERERREKRKGRGCGCGYLDWHRGGLMGLRRVNTSCHSATVHLRAVGGFIPMGHIPKKTLRYDSRNTKEYSAKEQDQSSQQLLIMCIRNGQGIISVYGIPT
jgi:hypothetical protein